MTWNEAIKEILFPIDPRSMIVWLLIGIILGIMIGIYRGRK